MASGPVSRPAAAGEPGRAPRPFYSIGHSTRALEELVALLQGAGVTLLVDVRTVPRSRTNPQYDREAMPEALAPHGIAYRHMAALGGLRGRRKDAPSPNDWWTNTSFRNYADHALAPAYREAIAELRLLGHASTCAVMCAEAVWWRCHRRIIADYLLVAGEEVLHIMERGRLEPAKLTPAARLQPDGSLVYRAPA